MSPAKKHHRGGGRRSALEMLTRCHQRLDGVMAELAVGLTDGDDEVVEDSLAFLRGSYRRHIADEETSVFPLLGTEHAGIVAQLTSEHRTHETLIEELSSAWQRRDGRTALAHAVRLRAELGKHSQIEEKRVWPAIEQLSGQSLEQARLDMRARRQR